MVSVRCSVKNVQKNSLSVVSCGLDVKDTTHTHTHTHTHIYGFHVLRGLSIYIMIF